MTIALASPAQMADRLQLPERKLYELLDNFNSYVDNLVIIRADKPDKPRSIVSIRRPLSIVQRNFYRWILVPSLVRSRYSHGGVPGRSIRSNARVHVGQSFVYTTDIQNFFPSIHYERVSHLFEMLGCSSRVAGLCTRLCTHNAKLAQGLATSPILADQILKKFDNEFSNACKGMNLKFTRYVDDITVSGQFDIRKSGVPKLIAKLLRCDGFHSHKDRGGALADGLAITKVRIRDGHLDAEKKYIDELTRQLHDLRSLGQGGKFEGPYQTSEQMWGRVQYVCWLNRRRSSYLSSMLSKINWQRVRSEAKKRGLVIADRSLVVPADPSGSTT